MAMASFLRRLASNSGKGYRSGVVASAKTPSKSQFLCTAAVETDTLKPLDVEASRAKRAAFTEARRKKLEGIADRVMELNKMEYKDYADLLRHKLCRGEKSLFDVKLEKFEAGSKLEVIRAMLDFAVDLGLKEINDLLEGAPSVVKKGLVKEEAEKIVEKLKEAGATAVVE